MQIGALGDIHGAFDAVADAPIDEPEMGVAAAPLADLVIADFPAADAPIPSEAWDLAPEQPRHSLDDAAVEFANLDAGDQVGGATVGVLEGVSVHGERGLAAAGVAEAPGRLLYPQRRVGARGSGQWQRVSWDEALDEMAERLAAVSAAHGPLAIAGATSGGYFSRSVIHALLLRSIGSPNWMINQDLCGGCRGVSS